MFFDWVLTLALAPWGGTTVIGAISAGIVARFSRKSGSDRVAVILVSLATAAFVVFLYQSIAVPTLSAIFRNRILEREVASWVVGADPVGGAHLVDDEESIFRFSFGFNDTQMLVVMLNNEFFAVMQTHDISPYLNWQKTLPQNVANWMMEDLKTVLEEHGAQYTMTPTNTPPDLRVIVPMPPEEVSFGGFIDAYMTVYRVGQLADRTMERQMELYNGPLR